VVVDVAGPNDPWPLWAQEASGTSGGPPIGRVLVAGALVLAMANLWPSATDGGRAGEHRVVSPACAETARLRAHGATGGQPYRSARAACARAEGR
jgi:hypothetical protein